MRVFCMNATCGLALVMVTVVYNLFSGAFGCVLGFLSFLKRNLCSLILVCKSLMQSEPSYRHRLCVDCARPVKVKVEILHVLISILNNELFRVQPEKARLQAAAKNA
nr:hypothetical protein [Tanacetum cinerariifolium]